MLGNHKGTIRCVAIALVGFFALTGCSAYGPTRESSYLASASSALPAESGEVLMSGPGLWAPFANGFANITSQPQPLQGSILVTSEGIYFQQWIEPESRYDTMEAIRFSDVDSVRIEEWALNLRVVVKENDLSVTSFSYMGDRHERVDKEKTRKALDALEAQLAEAGK
jgi:hypothetical protein